MSHPIGAIENANKRCIAYVDYPGNGWYSEDVSLVLLLRNP
jgi:hypothetical protein